MSVSCLYHVCILSVSCLYDVCMMSVSCLYHVCIMSVSCLYHVCIMSVSCLYDVCIISVSCPYHFIFQDVSVRELPPELQSEPLWGLALLVLAVTYMLYWGSRLKVLPYHYVIRIPHLIMSCHWHPCHYYSYQMYIIDVTYM